MKNPAFEECYRTLGLRPPCTWVEIRTAYRRQVRKYHPDRQICSDPHEIKYQEERFKQIAAAYQAIARYRRASGRLPYPERNNLAGVNRRRDQIRTHRRYSSYFLDHRATRYKFLVAALALTIPMVSTVVGLVADHDAARGARSSSHPGIRSFDRPLAYGMQLGEVYAVGGVPTRTTGSVWYYGPSSIVFHNGRVVAWQTCKEQD